MENCIFCKIVAGDIPTQKTFENDFVLAFPDIHPKAPGHTLLIPREHHVWFQEMPNGLYDEVFRAVKTLTHKLKEEHRADYVQISIVGRDVPHVHIHLIPRALTTAEHG